MKNYEDQIFDFLTGNLPKEKYSGFIKEVSKSGKLQKRLEKEANLEILFYSQKWNSEDLLKQGIFSDSSNNFSETEIKDLLPKEKFFSFHYKPLYYAAALLILSITLFISFFTSRNTNADIKISTTFNNDTIQHIITKEEDNNIQIDTPPEMKKYDIIKIAQKKQYLPRKISSKASYIDKGNSIFKILKNSDSIAVINLIKGELQFSVKTGSYKKFAVITNHAEIRVTGTIFSVYTDSANTNTTVYRGSVLITDKSGTQAILEADRANALNININNNKNGLIKEQMIIDTSKSFLNDFLNQYNKDSQNQLPKDTVISDLNNITYRILDTIKSNLTPETDAQLMHYNAGRKYASDKKSREAIKIFEQMLSENLSAEIKAITIIQLGQLYLEGNIKYFKSDFKEEIISSINKDVYKNLLLLEIYSDKKNRSFDSFYKNSEDFLNQFPNDKLNDYLYWYLAQYDINNSDFNKAISRFENIIDKYPNSQFAQDANYRLGWCLINRPKEFSGLK